MEDCQGSADIDDGTYGEISTRSIHLDGFQFSATIDLVLATDLFAVKICVESCPFGSGI